MDVRQFNKNRGAVSKKPTGIPRKSNPDPKGMKTFSAGFSKTSQESGHVRKNSDFGIWTGQMSTQVGKEKVLFERKQEQKRRIAIEAIKLAEQRKQEMMKRNNTENEVKGPVVVRVKPETKNETRRALFSLDFNQPGKVKTNFLSVVVPKLPPIKEVDPVEHPKGRPILKAKPFSDRDSKTKKIGFSLPTDLMKGLKLDEHIKSKKKVIFRYSAKELMNMNPIKKNPKFKDIQK